MIVGSNGAVTSPTVQFAASEEPQLLATGRVIIGYDGSGPAGLALAWAGDEAVRRGARMHVVHAWMPPYPIGPRDLFADLTAIEDAAQATLDHAAQQVARRASVPIAVEWTLVMDDAADALLASAADADMLVVGARDRRPLLGVGSISRQCMERSHCPVVVVPAGAGPGGDGRIVVGFDGSHLSDRALRWAAREATIRNARLDLVHALERGVRPSPGRPEVATASLPEVSSIAAQELRALQHRTTLREVIGSTADALVDAAAGADLLVLGAHGRAHLRDRVMGSVAQRCIEWATCPVAVVHSDDDGAAR